MVRVMPMAGWAPAPFRPQDPREIGQAAQSVAKPAFIDSALINFLTDAAASTASGLLGRIYGKAGSSWSTFFWVVSAVTGFKALVDLSRIRER